MDKTKEKEPTAEVDPLAEHDWDQQKTQDDQVLEKLLSFDPTSQQPESLNFDFGGDGDFSQEGKADDAEDYGDISDDDLPDEEEPITAVSAELPGLTDDTGTSNETDDLFGDGAVPSSPTDAARSSSPLRTGTQTDHTPPSLSTNATSLSDHDRALNFPEAFAPDANQDPTIPAPPENQFEAAKKGFPLYERGVTLNFNELYRPRPLELKKFSPNKLPKPLFPTKLSLAELEPDQEKLFRIPGPACASVKQRANDAEAKGQVSLLKAESLEGDDLDIFRSCVDDDDSEPVGGFGLPDFELVCCDWDELMEPPTPPAEPEAAVRIAQEDDEWDREFLEEPPRKRRKMLVEPGLPAIARIAAPWSFDSFEEATARSSKRVHLDLSDPYLLLDDADPDRPTKRPKLQHKQQRMANGHMGRDIWERFNYSNDKEYEQLKENHQNKIRSQHSAIQIEHSRPASKLLWPYYSIRQFGPEPHDYHRPQLKVGRGINMNVPLSRPHKVPRKAQKAKKVQEQFYESRDLSLNDNAAAVLFEYCEEIPTVLSNFGMGNKITNYYRLRSRDDEEGPSRLELGEGKKLLPEDKSPFSIFGTVDPGETVPTLENPMFHAPIFKHAPRDTDFLFGRCTTGASGSSYYLRKINHLFVVGQNFPITSVPGPHSRRVTTLAKERLKMVAFRIMHKKGHVSLSDITDHVRDSNDAQNRQKLKEFLHYEKENRTWGLKEGEHLMDLATINTLVKPEEVCLVDAMQVGQNELAQNGYQLDETANMDDEDDDDEKGDVANSMVPWKTTRAFIDARSGKAMLALHGAGDPTGRGLGFSFIKTSMKGGYVGAVQGPAATSADAMERERKANGGHSYNVKKQEKMYNEAIQKIWDSQKMTLEDSTAHEDEDVQPQDDEDDRLIAKEHGATPAHVEDAMSQMSRPSASHIQEKRKLRIMRKYRDPETGREITKSEIVHDSGVISQYMRQRALLDTENINPYDVKPTGNQDYDRVVMNKIEKEEERLNRNKERRHAREQQKARQRGIETGDPDSPAPSIEKAGTQRKCANCGQRGHIKTNKKLCPMLNGERPMSQQMEDDGGFGVYSAPSSLPAIG